MAGKPLKIPSTLLGIRFSALVEMALFFILVLSLDAWLGDGTRFFAVMPHPFWIILLLVTVQYGTNEGIICAVIASILLLAWNLPVQEFNENIYDYLFRVSLDPLLWLSSAVILGQIRMRHVHQIRTLTEELKEAKERESTITDAYTRLKEIKEMLEVRLASQVKSNSAAYNAFHSIEMLDRKSILLGVEDMIRAVMDPQKFSVYALGETGFESIACTGWDEEESYARRFDTRSRLYQELVGRKRALCVINEEDASILGTEGIMAAPLLDPASGRIFGMIKIEELSFTELTLSNVETFRILCELVGMAYANAERFQKALNNSLLNLETGLLSWRLFRRQCALLKQLNIKTPCISFIFVSLAQPEKIKPEKRQAYITSLAHIATDTLPKNASVFSGQNADTELIFLLPNATLEDAETWKNKLTQAFASIDLSNNANTLALAVKQLDEVTL